MLLTIANRLKKRFIIAILAVCFVILAVILFIQFKPKPYQPSPSPALPAESLSCITKTTQEEVRGGSLSGLVENGQTVTLLYGYYGCNEVNRGDIVAYQYGTSDIPIIKIVKGISGDTFHLQKDTGADSAVLLINGELVKNSNGETYQIDKAGFQMLSLYEKDYKGVIPDSAYLILGNLANGSLDSTRFGLISKSDLIGKILP